jgi:hypothetical protein
MVVSDACSVKQAAGTGSSFDSHFKKESGGEINSPPGDRETNRTNPIDFKFARPLRANLKLLNPS